MEPECGARTAGPPVILRGEVCGVPERGSCLIASWRGWGKMDTVTENAAESLPSWYQPTAHVATGMVFTDDRGCILLVKPTYEAGRLMGVDYRPPIPGGRGSALRFVFDGGALTAAQIARIVLPTDEIREWRYVSVDETDAYVIPVLARRLSNMLAGHVYLEEGRLVRPPLEA